MIPQRWMLGFKRCECVNCTSGITIEETTEKAGWCQWMDVSPLVEENKSLKDELKMLRHERVHDLGYLGELSAEIAHLKEQAKNTPVVREIPALYSTITFAGRQCEVVRIGARPDTEEDKPCIRVTITLLEQQGKDTVA